LDFEALIKRRTEWFVGRDAVFEKLVEFEKENDCGYFHILGDAGLGKTALAPQSRAILGHQPSLRK
jgi:hypothetical protein